MHFFNMELRGLRKNRHGFFSNRGDVNLCLTCPSKFFHWWMRYAVQTLSIFIILCVVFHMFLLQYTREVDNLPRALPEKREISAKDEPAVNVRKAMNREKEKIPGHYLPLQITTKELQHIEKIKVKKSKTSNTTASKVDELEKTVEYLSKQILITYSFVSSSGLNSSYHDKIRRRRGGKHRRKSRTLKQLNIKMPDREDIKQANDNGQYGLHEKDNHRRRSNGNQRTDNQGYKLNMTGNRRSKYNSTQALGKGMPRPQAKTKNVLKHSRALLNERPNIVKLTIRNNGTETIKTLNWEIVYSQMSGISRMLPAAAFTNQTSEAFGTTRVTENVFRLFPSRDLKAFLPGQDYYVFYVAVVPAHRFDVFPNWYIVAPNIKPRIIESTAGESLSFVKLFDEPEAHKIVHPGGLRSARARFEEIDVIDQGSAPIPIIPTPLFFSQEKDHHPVIIGKDWEILYDAEDLKEDAHYLSEKLHLNVRYLNVVDTEPRNNAIKLSLGAVRIPYAGNQTKDHVIRHDSYELQSETNKVDIKSPSSSGIFYGIQSLLTLLKESDGTFKLPITSIKDAPRLEYRGLMLDVSRNFFEAEEIIKVIDILSRYKMNKLHLHLTDSQGWRIEIPGLPELTEFGGRRGHDVREADHLMSVFGSGPSATGLGCGYYRKVDYRRILKHAKKNHVEIIPEIDLPGHARAAIRAMQLRYDKYKTTDIKKAERFLLSQSNAPPKLGVNPRDNVVSMQSPSTYRFVEHVLNELVNMHKDILPLKTIHLGADEVSSLRHGEQLLFTKQFIDIAFRHNLSLHLWQDHSLPHLAAVWPYSSKQSPVLKDHATIKTINTTTTTEKSTIHRRVPKRRKTVVTSNKRMSDVECPNFPGPVVTLQHWRNEDKYQTAAIYRILRNCYKLIQSAANRLYLDQPQDTDPEMRGNMWAAYKINARDVHSYTPDFPMDNIGPGVLENGAFKKSMRDICASRQKNANDHCEFLPTRPENNYGLEVALWTELIRTPDQMYEMLLPRLLAAAERAWHRAGWEWESGVNERAKQRQIDWNNFINTLGYREFEYLDKLGLPYFIPPPGARFEKGKLRLKSEYPGLPMELSTDDKKSWNKAEGKIMEELNKYSHIYVRTKSRDGRRSSRAIQVIQSN